MSYYIGLMFCHWIADFLLQNDWMALNKSKQSISLLAHCLVYTTTMVLWIGVTVGCPVALVIVLKALGLLWLGIFASHFAIDWLTSRLNHWLWNQGHRHWFFVSIGFDQWLHFVTLVWLSQELIWV